MREGRKEAEVCDCQWPGHDLSTGTLVLSEREAQSRAPSHCSARGTHLGVTPLYKPPDITVSSQFCLYYFESFATSNVWTLS